MRSKSKIIGYDQILFKEKWSKNLDFFSMHWYNILNVKVIQHRYDLEIVMNGIKISSWRRHGALARV